MKSRVYLVVRSRGGLFLSPSYTGYHTEMYKPNAESSDWEGASRFDFRDGAEA